MAKRVPTENDIQGAEQALRGSGIQFVKSTTGRLFISAAGAGGCELHPFDPKAAPELVTHLLWSRGQFRVPRYLKDALSYLAHKARRGVAQPVSVRVAERGSTLYLDLCDPDRRVVEVTAAGWRVVTDCPVLFYRPPNSSPLPVPVRGGTPDDIRRVLHVADDTAWLLVLGWLLAAIKEGGEHFLLALQGPPGGGKSVLARNLVRLVDPRDPPLAQLQWSADDVLLSAAGRWLFGVDDVDSLTADKVRVLSTICTGIGHEVRRKWTDSELSTTSVRRPVIATSNSAMLNEARLRDRAVHVTLPRIRPEDKLALARLESDIDASRDRLLGALLDLAVKALGHTGEVIDATDNIRMVEAALWAEKGAQAAGFPRGAFVRAVAASQRSAAEATAAEWPVLPPLVAIARDGFSGTPDQLYAALSAHRLATTHDKRWPKSTSVLGRELNGRAKDVREAGVLLTRSTRTGNQALISLRHTDSTEGSVGTVVTGATPAQADTNGTEVGHAADPLALAAAVPGLLVVQELGDVVRIHGHYAEAAGRLLGRSVEPWGGVTVTEGEFERVNTELNPANYFVV